MATGAPYTEAEILRAIRLHDSGLPWRIVGKRLGRPQGGLSVTVSNYRRGMWAPAQKLARSKTLNDRIETLVADGFITPAEVGLRVGLTRFAASMRLVRMGLDLEMRRELAATRPLAKPLLGARP